MAKNSVLAVLDHDEEYQFYLCDDGLYNKDPERLGQPRAGGWKAKILLKNPFRFSRNYYSWITNNGNGVDFTYEQSLISNAEWIHVSRYFFEITIDTYILVCQVNTV